MSAAPDEKEKPGRPRYPLPDECPNPFLCCSYPYAVHTELQVVFPGPFDIPDLKTWRSLEPPSPAGVVLFPNRFVSITTTDSKGRKNSQTVQARLSSVYGHVTGAFVEKYGIPKRHVESVFAEVDEQDREDACHWCQSMTNCCLMCCGYLFMLGTFPLTWIPYECCMSNYQEFNTRTSLSLFNAELARLNVKPRWGRLYIPEIYCNNGCCSSKCACLPSNHSILMLTLDPSNADWKKPLEPFNATRYDAPVNDKKRGGIELQTVGKPNLEREASALPTTATATATATTADAATDSAVTSAPAAAAVPASAPEMTRV